MPHSEFEDDWDEKTAVAAAAEIDQPAPGTGGSDAMLVVLTGPAIGRSYALSEKSVSLGRSEAAGIYIPDPRISREHCRIFREGSTYLVADLGSTNGTFVDSTRVEAPIPLQNGMRIQLGSHSVVKFQRMDALEAAVQRRLNDAVFTDALTGAHNRRYMDLRLAEEFSFARRHLRPLSLLLLDIDHFKAVNDNHGHQAGDDVLRGLSGMLRRFIRREDVLCRYGGEEFLIIARGITQAQGMMFAERVRDVVSRTPMASEKNPLTVTVSIGVATYTQDPDDTLKTVMGRADQALYRAKNGGRNRVEGEASA